MRYTRFAMAQLFINLTAVCLPNERTMAFVLLMAANTAIKREIAIMKGGKV